MISDVVYFIPPKMAVTKLIHVPLILVVAISFFADCNGGLNQNKFVD